jgi:hypothetical protein
MTYRLRSGDITFAFADRESKTRQHSNFYFNVPGRACLIRGGINALEAIVEIIEFLGGVIEELWFQRLDLCVDMPGVDFQRDFYPSLANQHFLTTAKRWTPHDGTDGPTGFTVSSANLALRFYNKLLLVQRKPDEEVAQFMRVKRWLNETPPCATRVEIEIRRAAQHHYGLETTEETLRRVPDMVDKFLGKGPYPFFRLLDGPVDKANKHQNRGVDHPLWQGVLEQMSKISGQKEEVLRPSPRQAVTGKNDFSRIFNALIRSSLAQGRLITTRDELVEHLVLLCRNNLIEDGDVESRAVMEARKRGVLDELLSFNPSEL